MARASLSWRGAASGKYHRMGRAIVKVSNSHCRNCRSRSFCVACGEGLDSLYLPDASYRCVARGGDLHSLPHHDGIISRVVLCVI